MKEKMKRTCEIFREKPRMVMMMVMTHRNAREQRAKLRDDDTPLDSSPKKRKIPEKTKRAVSNVVSYLHDEGEVDDLNKKKNAFCWRFTRQK
jgi:hypothetical protein